jgi:hypothetical protein
MPIPLNSSELDTKFNVKKKTAGKQRKINSLRKS